MAATQPVVESLYVYPIKSFDGTAVSASAIGPGGGLQGDRRWALHDANDRILHAKRSSRIHLLRVSFDPTLTVATFVGPRPNASAVTFDLHSDAGRASAFLSDFLEHQVVLKERPMGFPDDPDILGPTIIGTGTLDEVASWFPDLAVADIVERTRPNIVVRAPEPFWEERLVSDESHQVAFEVGGLQFFGVAPTDRCVVPTRDPRTGEKYEGFQKQFTARREADWPAFVDRTRFRHGYYLTVRTNAAPASVGKTIRVGDSVALGQPIAI